MKRWILLVTVAGCGKAAEAPTPTPPAADPAAVAVAPDTPTPSSVPDTGEAGALARSAGVARRAGPVLTLSTRSGAAVTLADDSTEGDGYVSYQYKGRLSGAPFYLVRVGHYEGGSWLLVHDSTGRRRQVDGFPIVAPGGARLVIANMDLEAAFEPNVVEVFRVTGDSLVSEWRVEPDNWGPDSLSWRGDTVAFVQLWRDGNASEYQPVRTLAVRRNGTWTLVTPPKP